MTCSLLTIDTGPFLTIAGTALVLLVYVASGLVPFCALLYLLYYLLTLPMRRHERAGFFLDLVELGLREGRAPEMIIVEAARSRDRSLGTRFRQLAARLEQGARLDDALREVPRLLPPGIEGMLKTGERIGDLGKVLPACRRLLADSVSQVQGALNYLLLLAFLVTPVSILVPIMLKVFVLPKFFEIFQGLGNGAKLPVFTALIFSRSGLVFGVQIAVVMFMWLIMLAYVGGPRIQGWVQRILPAVPDQLQFCLPWRRKRLQRDFSAMLAVLLDAEVPEQEAVALAADSTANTTLRRRAARVVTRLIQGSTLPEALRLMDDSGELHWRLANALRSGRGFLRTLNGWHDALDARAFQSEQAAAQIATTALVLFNGFVIGSVVIAMFLALINILNQAVLW